MIFKEIANMEGVGVICHYYHKGTKTPNTDGSDYQKRPPRRAGAGVRARARGRAERVHGGAAGRAGAAGCAFPGGGDREEVRAWAWNAKLWPDPATY